MTEEERVQLLVRKAQQGDHAAFEALISWHREKLRTAIRSRIGTHLRHKLDVDDVLQDAFTRAFQSIRKFSWQGADSFFYWLKGIAVNLILKAAERRQREQLLLIRRQERAGGKTLVSPSKAARRDERFHRLEEALDALSPEHREIILLARIDGLQIKEIAKRLNKSVPAIKGILFRALRKLKDEFGDTESLSLPERSLDGREESHEE